MDMLIEGYIVATYHSDFADIIRRAFKLMEEFEVSDYDFDFVNLLMSADDQNHQSVQDHFTTLIHQKLDYIVHAHLITLSEVTALHQKVAVLEGLYAVQHLNDYSNIIIILEAEYDHEEKLAEVLGQVCDITPMEALSIIERFDHTVLDTLKSFIYNKEQNEGKLYTSYSETQKSIIKNLKLFKEYNKNKNCLGLMLLDSNVLIGQPLEAYIPYVDDYLRSDNYDELSVNVFSLLLMSNEGNNNPILAFRKHSGLILDDLHSISKIDTMLIGILNGFEKFKTDKASGATE